MTRWQAFRENANVNYILKAWRAPDPRTKTAVRRALDGVVQWASAFQGGHNDPNYLDLALRLGEVLPYLAQEPMYRDAAEQLSFIFQHDRQQAGIAH